MFLSWIASDYAHRAWIGISMKVSELIEILKLHDQDMPIGLFSMGHAYSSLNDTKSHGKLEAVEGRINSGVDHLYIGHAFSQARFS